MSDFEKWFEDQDFYTNMRFIHGDKLFDKDGDVYRVLPVQMAYQGWNTQRQRSKDEFVELTQEWHTKGWNARQGEIDELKVQLNNMEACYIEKKKECEDQQSKIDELNQHIKRLESKLDSLGADRQELVGQVNDLQKQNAWLSDVAERENNRANNLQQDKTSTTILLGKTIQEKNKLQKRINEALVCVDQAKDGFYGFSCEGGDTDNLAKHLEKALRGGHV